MINIDYDTVEHSAKITFKYRLLIPALINKIKNDDSDVKSYGAATYIQNENYILVTTTTRSRTCFMIFLSLPI
jgi:hypothetical protein